MLQNKQLLIMVLLTGILGNFLLYAAETKTENIIDSINESSASLTESGSATSFGTVQGGANLFTGDVSLTVPLLSLPGRGGLSFSAALNYNSNVHLLRNVENQYQQGPGVGLGWSLGFGAIVADINNTKNKTDDVFHFIDGSGMSKIVKDGDHYTLQNDPFWIVEPTCDVSDTMLVTGWTLTDKSGTVYKFGDFQTGFGTKKSNRCVPHWGNWVGNGTVNADGLVCFQWDIVSITDITGENKIEFYYTQELDTLDLPTQDISYTRASYIDYVIDSYGRKIDFHLAQRNSGEWNNLSADYQLKKYETQYIDSVSVFRSSSETLPFNTVKLASSLSGSGDKTKRQLDSLVFYSEKSRLPSLQFQYAGSSEDNEGALDKIIFPHGGSKSFTYDEKNLTYFDQDTDTDATIFSGGSTANTEILFKSSSSSFAYVDKDDDSLYVWKWGGTWHHSGDIMSSEADVNDRTKLAVTDKHIAYFVSDYTGSPLDQEWYINTWDEHQKAWKQTFKDSVSGYMNHSDIVLSGNLCAYFRRNPDIQVDSKEIRILEYNESKATWDSTSTIDLSSYVSHNPEDFYIQLQSGLLLFFDYTSTATDFESIIFRYNENKTWTQVYNSTHSKTQSGQPVQYHWFLKNENIALFRINESNKYATLYLKHFDGSTIIADTTVNFDPNGFNMTPYIIMTDNHVLVCQYLYSSSNKKGILHLWDRDKDGWDYTKLYETNLADNKGITATISERFIAFFIRYFQDAAADHGPIWFSEWNSTTWSTADSVNYSTLKNTDLDEVDFVITGNKLILHSFGTHSYQTTGLFTKVWHYDDGEFQNKTDIFNSNNYNASNVDRQMLFIGSNYAGVFRDKVGAIKVKLVHGQNEWDNTVTDYPIQHITESDGFTTESIKNQYTFTTPAFDPALSAAGYNKAKTEPAGSFGYIEQYSYNSLSDDLLKYGYPYKFESYNETQSLVAKNSKKWEADSMLFSNDIVKTVQVQLHADTTTQDGIVSVTANRYSKSNGLVDKITQTNTDGTVRIAKTDFAHKKYSGMESKNMLTQVAQQTIFQTDTTAANAKSSTVTTWKNWNSSFWAPNKTYSWLEDDATNGMPVFNFTSWSGDTEPSGTGSEEWLRTGKVQRVDVYGHAVKTLGVDGLPAVEKYSFNSTLPVLSAINADSGECAYLNLENGWEDSWTSGSSVITDSLFYTGDSSAYCWDDYGPSRNFFVGTEGIDTSRTFVAEAWINRIAGFGKISITGKNAQGTDVSGCHVHKTVSTGAGWQPIRVEIPPDSMRNLPSDGYLRLYCGFPGSGNEGFVDDIRFYPKDAAVQTTVYDPAALQSVASFDANNMAVISQYDGFGNVVAGRNEDKQIIQASSHYLSRDGNSNVFSSTDPNFNHSIIYSDPDGFSDFSSSDGWMFSQPCPSTFNHVHDGEITLRMGNSWGWYNVSKTPDSTDFVLRVDLLYPSSPTDGTAHIMLQEGTCRFAVRYMTTGQDTLQAYTYINSQLERVHSFRLPADRNVWYTVEIEKTVSGICRAWVYPKGASRDYTDMAVDSSACFQTWNPDIIFASNRAIQYYLANFYTGASIQSKVFTDGLGRQIQTQAQKGNNDIVSRTAFNSMGKVATRIFPQEFSNRDHIYITSVTGADETFQYYSDPMARIKKQIHNDNTEREYSYGSGWYQSRLYSFIEVEDENNKTEKSYYDKFGNNVRTVVPTFLDSLHTSQTFDIMGNVLTVKPPNYYKPPNSDASDWDSNFEYNTLGQLVSKTTPDDSTTRYVYDEKGNLLYSQNALQRHDQNGRFTVYWYDDLGRIILVGVERNTSWTSAASPAAPDSCYGNGADEWKIKKFYDDNYVQAATNYCQGQLTKIWINQDSDMAAEDSTRYVYDRAGNIAEKHISMDGLAGSKIFRHTYDHLGRETQVEYPSGNTLAKRYGEFGRLEEILLIEGFIPASQQ